MIQFIAKTVISAVIPAVVNSVARTAQKTSDAGNKVAQNHPYARYNKAIMATIAAATAWISVIMGTDIQFSEVWLAAVATAVGPFLVGWIGNNDDG